ncbi:FtsX-like permease family protein [Scytonema sp. UIC 10036]|uniref:ABC transporter permease DevC n=1 Tax=Scytonema sp. UIC 10036 TaxID=2304196 RepID=UPI0012DA5DCE|nr:ABC transporter permease DevC [Scytonema sp. UIC 10036]MUH01677.1 FtsX-like permease family protein [Scytonema sp. UIC 10036]
MLRQFFRKTPLSWLQVTREKSRLAIALAGIAFADVLMFVQLGLMDSLYDSAKKVYDTMQGDLFIVNPLSDNIQSVKSFPRARLYQAAGVKGVESINSLYIGQGDWRNPQNLANRNALVIGINPAKPAFNLPEVNERLNDLKVLNQVLYDEAGRPQFGNVPTLLQKQNSLSVQVNDVEVKVVGLFRIGTSFGINGSLITSDSTFLRLFPKRQPDQIDIGIVNLKPDSDIKKVQKAIQAYLPKDVLVLTKEEFVDREKMYWAVNSPVGFIFGFGATVGFFVGFIIVYQILYSDVSDHLPEYATLKAMGYGDNFLIGVIVQESLILAILGFLPGFVLSIGLYQIAQKATLLPIMMNLSRSTMVLLLTIIMCIASAAVSMGKLRSADPADVF